jgi:hypothetical protein
MAKPTHALHGMSADDGSTKFSFLSKQYHRYTVMTGIYMVRSPQTHADLPIDKQVH